MMTRQQPRRVMIAVAAGLLALLIVAPVGGADRERIAGDDPLGFYNVDEADRPDVRERLRAARDVPLTRWAMHGFGNLHVDPSPEPGILAALDRAWPLGFSRADTDAAVLLPTHRERLDVFGVIEPIGLAFDREGVAADDGHVAIPFPAALLPPGDYTLHVGVSDAVMSEAVELPVIVGPYLHYDRFHAYHWNSGGGSQEALESRIDLAERTNLSVIDLPFVPAPDALRHGLMLSAHEVTIHSRHVSQYAATPELIDRAARRGEMLAHAARRYNHVRWLLPNSEYGSHQLRRYFNDPFAEALREHVDVDMDTLRRGSELAEAQTAEGIYPDDLPELEAARFARGEGGGWFRLNRVAAEAVRELAPGTTIWLDPVRSVEQFEGLDAVSFWEYSPDPFRLLGRLRHAEAVARLHEQEMYVTISQWFLGVETEEGRSRVFRSPDHHRFNHWLIIAHGAEMLGYWAFDEIAEHAENADAVADALEQVGYPLGTLLRGVPAAPTPVAIYLSQKSDFLGAADRPHNRWFRHHYLNGVYPALLEKFQNLVVRLDDADIEAGRHHDYPVLVLPIFRATTERLRDELRAYQEAGGHIVGDELWRAEGLEPDDRFPGRHPSAYDLPYRNETISEWRAENRRGILDWQPRAADRLRFDLEADADDVILSHRRRDGVDYYVAVNNRFEKGEWSERFGVVDERYRDIGVDNEATLTLPVAGEAKVYDAVRNQPVDEASLNRADDRVHMDTTLPGAGGALYVVHPRPLRDLRVELAPDSTVARGTQMTLEIMLRDDQGDAAPGQSAVALTLTDPHGDEHDATGIFPLRSGAARVPLGIGLEAPTGAWTVHVRDLTSGLEHERTIEVTPNES